MAEERPDIAMLVHRIDDRAIAQLVLEIAGELAVAGARVLLVAAAGRPDDASRAPRGVEAAILGIPVDRTSFAVPRLAGLLRRRRPHVMFAHGNGPNRAAVAARLLARAPTRVVTVEHNHYSSYVSPTGGGYSHRFLRDRLTRSLYAHADCVAGVAPQILDDLVARFDGRSWRTAVLPDPGRSTESIRRLADETIEHPWYVAGSERPRIVCSVANVIPRKGQRVLVEALPLVRARAGDVRLVLVGREDSPSYSREITALAEGLGVREHMALVGFRRNPIPWMIEADVVALASFNEGCPRVLSEAMACGTPVVAADCPTGPAFVLDGGRAGLLVPPGDPRALAEALASVLLDTGLRRRLVAAGRERARDFTPQRVASSYLDLARELGSPPPRARTGRPVAA